MSMDVTLVILPPLLSRDLGYTAGSIALYLVFLDFGHRGSYR